MANPTLLTSFHSEKAFGTGDGCRCVIGFCVCLILSPCQIGSNVGSKCCSFKIFGYNMVVYSNVNQDM